jgi:uridine kinase
LNKDTLVIGICGGSGTGKTTIIEELIHLLRGHSPSLLSMDNYYKELDQQVRDEQGRVNFDLPNAIDIPSYLVDLEKLIRGESIQVKKYTFNVKSEPQFLNIQSSKIILTEGIFLFNVPEAMDIIDVKIYVELDHDLQLKRRIQRDVFERGYDKDSVMYQWKNHVVPAFENYIEIHKSKADVIFTNDGDLQHLVQHVDRFILNHPRINEFCLNLTQ